MFTTMIKKITDVYIVYDDEIITLYKFGVNVQIIVDTFKDEYIKSIKKSFYIRTLTDYDIEWERFSNRQRKKRSDALALKRLEDKMRELGIKI